MACAAQQNTNGDARVTLDESFAFAHSQTRIRSSKSSGVMQKPEAVVNLRETAPVVITQTSNHLASLALPQGRDTHFLVYSAGAKSVLSELWGRARSTADAPRSSGTLGRPEARQRIRCRRADRDRRGRVPAEGRVTA
jgi:hypothetical protein